MLGFLFRRKRQADPAVAEAAPASGAAPRGAVPDAELLKTAGSRVDVAAGGVVVAPGDGDRRVYQVLEGTVRTVATVGRRNLATLTLRNGDWFGTLDPAQPAPPAVAVAASRLLAVEPAAFAQLPERMQNAALRSLWRGQSTATRSLATAAMDLEAKNRLLVELIERGAGPARDEYVRCEMVGQLLDAVPRLPLYAVELIGLLRDGEASAARVSEVAEQDPSLAAAVLKEVNSAEYGLSGTVSDLHHAIMLLGFNHVHQMVIAQGVWRTMPDEPAFRELRAASLQLSQVAYELAKSCGEADAATLSTIGLLHNLGRSLVLLLRRRNPKFDLLIDLLDHAKLASLLLERWNLPERVCGPIEWQRHPEYAPPTEVPESCRRNVALLYASGLLVELLNGGHQEHVAGLFVDEYLDVLGLDQAELHRRLTETIGPALRRRQASRE